MDVPSYGIVHAWLGSCAHSCDGKAFGGACSASDTQIAPEKSAGWKEYPSEQGPVDATHRRCESVNERYLPMSVRDLTCCFLRLGNLDNGVFERLGRYNAALWKQTAPDTPVASINPRRVTSLRWVQLTGGPFSTLAENHRGVLLRASSDQAPCVGGRDPSFNPMRACQPSALNRADVQKLAGVPSGCRASNLSRLGNVPEKWVCPAKKE
jgi:hypothetical protein